MFPVIFACVTMETCCAEPLPEGTGYPGFISHFISNWASRAVTLNTSVHSLAEKILRLFFNSLYSCSLNFLFYGSHPVCLWSWCFVSTERKVRICGGREATRIPSEQERTRGVSGRSSGLSASVWVGPCDMLRHESHIHSIMLQTQEKHGQIIMKYITMASES